MENFKKWYTRFIQIVSNVITLILVVSLVSIISSVVEFSGDSQETTLFDHKLIFVKSASMEPEIMTHSPIIVKRMSPEKFEVGDVATYYGVDSEGVRGEYVTHRVEQNNIEEQTLNTRGINSSLGATPTMETIQYEDVRFKVVSVHNNFAPVVAYVSSSLSNAAIALVFLISLLSVIFYIGSIFYDSTYEFKLKKNKTTSENEK